MHGEHLPYLYSLQNVIRVIKKSMRKVGEVALWDRCAQRFSGENGKNVPLGRPRRRWEDKIQMDIQQIGREGMALVDLVQNREKWRVELTVISHRVP
jgi:hypothetical protein